MSLSEHQRQRLADPVYRAKQKTAAAKAASAWLKKKHADDPAFHRRTVEAARRNLNRLNADPDFRAAAAERMKASWKDPALRARRAETARKTMQRLNADPAFRAAAAARLKKLHKDPGFHRARVKASRARVSSD